MHCGVALLTSSSGHSWSNRLLQVTWENNEIICEWKENVFFFFARICNSSNFTFILRVFLNMYVVIMIFYINLLIFFQEISHRHKGNVAKIPNIWYYHVQKKHCGHYLFLYVGFLFCIFCIVVFCEDKDK